MTSEIHNPDAERAKSIDLALKTQPVFVLVIRPNPFFPGAHMIVK